MSWVRVNPMICCNQAKTNGDDQLPLPLSTAASVAESPRLEHSTTSAGLQQHAGTARKQSKRESKNADIFLKKILRLHNYKSSGKT